MPGFFIDRPVFAWVVAILITLGGLVAMLNLGVESYPSIAPPQIIVRASFPGASADTTEKSVTQVIEQVLTGIDNLLYFQSQSSSTGRSTITLTFATGTDPDTAQVQVQNKVALATPRLPSEVTLLGVSVAKAAAGYLMVVALRSDNPSIDRNALNDIVASRVLDQISRVTGVGDVQQFGSEYAMRIWLDPLKLQGYALSSTQVLAAVRSQNVQFAAGSLGADPAPAGQAFTANVSAEGRLTTPEQFERIILRANPDGTAVNLSDVARVAFGPENYGFDSRYDGRPLGAFGIQLLPGANALQVGNAVREKMDQLAPTFPAGVTWMVPYDSTTFVEISINEVVKTLFEAMILVFLVLWLFLQSLRATLIPMLVIPIALLGTFIGLMPLGFTINQLTLFGMVLAIGIVVDDAIVVIENVERIMAEEGLSPKQATRKAMGQITGAVVAITAVLVAVFVPSALQGGAAGVIYRQFALTIAISMALSAFLALSLTPALCAVFLKPAHGGPRRGVFRWFNQGFESATHVYVGQVAHALRRVPHWMVVFVLLAALGSFLFLRLPGSFLPEEDQGYAMAVVQLPPGATLQRTNAALEQVRGVLEEDEAVEGVLQIAGFSFLGQGENVAMAFIRLKDWSERQANAEQFITRANGAVQGVRDARTFVVNMPTVSGLSQFAGFDMYLQDRTGAGVEALGQARNTLLAQAAQNPALAQVRLNTLEPAPRMNLRVDRVQAQSMGLSVGDIYTAIQLMLAPVYLNDFAYSGRVKRVTMQADAPFRTGPEALRQIFTPSATQRARDGNPQMIPIANVVRTQWEVSAPSLTRYNGYSAVEIVGSAAPGRASGEAMDAMQQIVRTALPAGFGYDWTGQSYQEILAGNTATLLLALSILIVFLCLAALYESWSVPVAVLLVVPLGLLGAVLFTSLRGLPNDLYFKIGLITVIGLAAKNAILIVEFALAGQAQGKSLRDAVLEAARLRLRPILMTSLAFILGVVPLALSTGAGANARHAIGTGVIGGMLFATILGVLFIPVFYVAMRRLLGDRLEGNDRARD
ncbi:MAG: multidrug efflux RND transporter permease subunit [Burkholderiales bacterium]|nr:multidrug efflux RND transporter permease subunit [Burkholderiales bacterium]